MELGLYNGFLGAVGLDGETFYYENPLRTLTGHFKERSRWFEVACCPPNVAKLMGNLGTFIFSTNQDRVVIHLYIESTLRIPGTSNSVSIKTDAPWSGDVEITWKGEVALAVRIPGWSNGYESSIDGTVKDGYLYLPSTTNGTLKLKFSFEARRMYANTKTGKHEVAIVRGPLVYCLEDVDNDIDVDNAVLENAALEEGPTIKILGNKIIPIVAQGREVKSFDNTKLYNTKPPEYGVLKDLMFIPYYARANRGGTGGMRVWCPYRH
ncbi:Non-reducing end beta-L-arabinofuranosidase [Paramyrothecium foliicola]|nr:Non-reducing end beta-L-arabinofuranosidase [Paramyrothecium foliicola]